jgi:hypothetical protein
VFGFDVITANIAEDGVANKSLSITIEEKRGKKRREEMKRNAN